MKEQKQGKWGGGRSVARLRAAASNKGAKALAGFFLHAGWGGFRPLLIIITTQAVIISSRGRNFDPTSGYWGARQQLMMLLTTSYGIGFSTLAGLLAGRLKNALPSTVLAAGPQHHSDQHRLLCAAFRSSAAVWQCCWLKRVAQGKSTLASLRA